MGADRGDEGAREPGAREIRACYDRVASVFDLLEGLPEFLVVSSYRERLFPRAAGAVLEVAVGTGRTLPYLRPGRVASAVAVDLSPGMLAEARRRAATLALEPRFAVMDGEALGFPDHSFDTVTTSLTVCTFPDPVAALREMARVCRPGGRILLLEHGRSDRGWLGRWQDRHAEGHLRRFCCHWNREPLALVREAGLRVVGAERRLLGMFHLVEAAP